MRAPNTVNRWIFLSIYYPPKEWGNLLQNGMIPFIGKIGRHHWTTFSFHFGYSKGYYIGVTCQVTSSKCKSFIVEFESFFLDFLCRHPSAETEASSRSGLYMDFPPNTICHSLHQFLPKVNGINQDEYHELWERSTLHLLKTFRNHRFRQEDLLIVAIYLNLMLLLSDEGFKISYLDKCRKIFNSKTVSLEEYVSIYEANKLALKELVGDRAISYKSQFHIERSHELDIWSSTCVEFASTWNQHSCYQRHEVTMSIFFTIRNQLGISNHTLADYFLFRFLTD